LHLLPGEKHPVFGKNKDFREIEKI
jgi:hypothetical protein